MFSLKYTIQNIQQKQNIPENADAMRLRNANQHSPSERHSNSTREEIVNILNLIKQALVGVLHGHRNALMTAIMLSKLHPDDNGT